MKTEFPMVYINMSVIAKTFGQNYGRNQANAKKTGRHQVVGFRNSGRHQVVNQPGNLILFIVNQLFKKIEKVCQKVIPLDALFRQFFMKHLAFLLVLMVMINDPLSAVTQKTDTTGFASLGDSVIRFIYDNPVKSLSLAKKRNAWALSVGDSTMIASSYSQMADVLTRLGVYDSALNYAFKALNTFERLGNKEFAAYNSVTIADIYSREKAMFDRSLDFYKKALKLYSEAGDTTETGGALMSISYLFSSQNQYDSAEYYALKAIDINKKSGNINYLTANYDNLAQIYGNMDKYDLAMAYFRKSEPLLKQFDNDLFWAGHYAFLVDTYERMGDFEKVLALANKGLNYAKKTGDREMTMEFYNGISNALEKTGKYRESLHYLHLADSLEQLLSDEQTKEKMAQTEALYRLNTMQNQLSLMEAKNRADRLTRTLLLLAILIVIIVFVFVILMIMRKRKNEKALYHYKTQLIEKKERLTKSELAQKQLREQELEKELEFKTRQLTTTALNIVQKNKSLNELSEMLRETEHKAAPEVKSELQSLRKAIERTVKRDKDWEIFKLHFEQVNPGFFERLKKINPALTQNDLRISAFIRLRLSIKESASILNLSPTSVKTARYKLRKKLSLAVDENLYEFIENV